MNDTQAERILEELKRQATILEGIESALERIADSFEIITEANKNT